MSTAISVSGGKLIVNAMKMISAKHNMPVSQLVHDALIEKYGDDLQEALSFFGESVESIQQSKKESNA